MILQMHTDCHIGVVTRFAEALDTEDYDAATATLAPDCTYGIKGVEHAGASTIIDTYRGNGDIAATRFDAIEYGSKVRPGAEPWVIIGFLDVVTHRGRRHVHTCEQWCRVGDDGRIARIEHHDLPGEAEALAEFKHWAWGDEADDQ